MSTAAQNKRRYRVDADYRSAILASNQRSRRRDPNPHRKRLNRLASMIWQARNSIEFHIKATKRQERRLIRMVAERERLKAEGRRIVQQARGAE